MKMKKIKYVQYTSELATKLYHKYQDDTTTAPVTISSASEDITADLREIATWLGQGWAAG